MEFLPTFLYVGFFVHDDDCVVEDERGTHFELAPPLLLLWFVPIPIVISICELPRYVNGD